jgi:hypothetical protein
MAAIFSEELSDGSIWDCFRSGRLMIQRRICPDGRMKFYRLVIERHDEQN